MKTVHFEPLEEFFKKEISPEEMVEYLNELEEECLLLKTRQEECERLYFLHQFRRVLMQCGDKYTPSRPLPTEDRDKLSQEGGDYQSA